MIAYDVAVVGMGPVGLIFANLLGNAGLDVVVLEKAAGLSTLPRAIAYDDETLRVLANVGLLDAIEPTLITSLKARFTNARGETLMEVEPHDTDYGHSALGTFHQPTLERVMLEGLARFPHVAVRFEHEVLAYEQDDRGVTVRVRSKAAAEPFDVRASYVVGCDGGGGIARKSIGAKLVGSSATERWLVVDAVVPDHAVDSIRFYCNPERPTVEVPAIGERVRWEFLQMAGESDETLLADETIRALLSRHIDPAATTLERTAVYTFRTLVADRWSRGRIFIAGDAAHMMPPFAGQGMNSGFKDASNLAWKLAAVLRSGVAPDVLASYEEERRPPTIRIAKISQGLGHVIMARSNRLAALRDVFFSVANRSPHFRAYIRSGGLRSQSVIGSARFFARNRGTSVRTMMPQPVVLTAHGSQLLDAAAGHGRWTLFGFENDLRASLASGERALLERFDVAFVRIDVAPSAPSDANGVAVGDARFVKWMRSRGCAGVLVRPDHFIAERVERGGRLETLHLLASDSSRATPLPERTIMPTIAASLEPVAKATALAYVRFERPDLAKAEAYLNDFGLVTATKTSERLYLRGSASQPFIYVVEKGSHARVVGLGLEVAAFDDLEALARANRTVVQPCEEPGGGSFVRLAAPNGLRIDAHYGRTPSAPLEQRRRIVHNGPGETQRVNATQRPPLEPPLVVRLGHAVVETTDFDAVFAWFRTNFGMLPSDVLQLPSGTPVAAFMRFDLGAVPADHHSIFVTMGLEERLDHVAFEVLDLDAVHMGEQYLRERNYRHAWGVGRHKLGSQIFDYWRDPWNQKHEHYADGDVFDNTVPAGHHPMDKAGLYQWGPDLPADFIDARITPRRAFNLIKRIVKDRSLAKRFGGLKLAMDAPGRSWQGRK